MFICVIIFFSCMVFGFVYLKTLLNKNMEKTVNGLNCDYIKDDTKDVTKEYAELDLTNHEIGKGIGTYHCYCKAYSDSSAIFDKTNLCYNYQYEHYFGKFFTWIIALIIVLSNSVIEKIFHFLTLKIGYRYKS